AAALSGRDEAVALRVRHEDGSEEDLALVAEEMETPTGEMRLFGIIPPQSLTVAELSKDDANDLHMKTGLLPGDRIKSVDGIDVQNYWELAEIVQNTYKPSANLSVERTKEPEKNKLVESEIALEWNFAESYVVDSESELYHIYSMVPRLRITFISDKLASEVEGKVSLFVDDVILSVGDVENPTYTQTRDIIEKYEDKELQIKVLRTNTDGSEKILAVTVKPKKKTGSDRVEIGIGLALDAEHPVVAKTIAAEGGPEKLNIQSGAVITAVDGAPVSNFYDIIREIRKYSGERITIDWRLNEEIAGDVVLTVDTGEEFITVKSDFAELIPFEGLKRLYKASGPIDAVAMGCKKTVMFIAQTYVTLRRLIGGLVSPKNLMGPAGIIAFSYRIVAEQPFVYYVYFLGLISAVIAVFNFLPLPPLDGGLVVLLLVEKIKGSELSERTQGVIAYVGWALIGTLLLYVTFNDIVRTFFS
ncbi:MAG: site-2 protease family protein, partial [Planctomycetota bacterium]